MMRDIKRGKEEEVWYCMGGEEGKERSSRGLRGAGGKGLLRMEKIGNVWLKSIIYPSRSVCYVRMDDFALMLL